MPNIVEITDLSAPELDVYARLTQAQPAQSSGTGKRHLYCRKPQGDCPRTGRRVSAYLLFNGAQADHRPGQRGSGPLRERPGVYR